MSEKKGQKNDQKKARTGQPKLGLRTLVRAETNVRSGCSKGNTSSCGINYRNG